MKILIMLLLASTSATSELADVRQLITVASEQEPANKKLIELTEGYTMDYKPLIFAYNAAAQMTMANHMIWPGTKLSYFYDGKKNLEAVVKAYNKDVEIRYIRYAVQNGSPSFLYYKGDMESDRKFIREHIKESSLAPDIKKIINDTVGGE